MSGQRVSVVVPVRASAATLKPLVERLTVVLAPGAWLAELSAQRQPGARAPASHAADPV